MSKSETFLHPSTQALCLQKQTKKNERKYPSKLQVQKAHEGKYCDFLFLLLHFSQDRFLHIGRCCHIVPIELRMTKALTWELQKGSNLRLNIPHSRGKRLQASLYQPKCLQHAPTRGYWGYAELAPGMLQGKRLWKCETHCIETWKL